jgi:hypothetical protein
MSAKLFQRVAVMGLLLAMPVIGAPAQTTRPRPKVITPAQATVQYSYQYGYRAGYDDGYVKGQSDFNDSRSRDIEGSTAYSSADRGYQENYGTRAEYQEAYRIGFEIAYNDGYFGRPRSTTLPTNLGRVVVATVNANSAPSQTATEDTSSTSSSSTSSRARTTGSENARGVSDSDDRDRRNSSSSSGSSGSSRNGGVVIGDGVQMKVRLMNEISTKVNQQGDKFSAVVLDPSDYAEAEVFGHIAKLNKSGKATGKTELSLVFDSIRLRDGRTGRLAAQVEKVYESDSVKEVDEEGNVQTGSRTKDTAVRGAGGAALGAIIGGIAGGGKGAAIGAILGGGVGAGSVYVQDGKDLVMSPGTEMLIRTSTPARTRDQ